VAFYSHGPELFISLHGYTHGQHKSILGFVFAMFLIWIPVAFFVAALLSQWFDVQWNVGESVRDALEEGFWCFLPVAWVLGMFVWGYCRQPRDLLPDEQAIFNQLLGLVQRALEDSWLDGGYGSGDVKRIDY